MINSTTTSHPLFEGNLFSKISPQEASRLESSKKKILLKKKEYLCKPGDPQTGLFFIKSGILKLYKTSPRYKPQLIRITGPGDIVGIDSLIDDRPFPRFIQAVETTELYWFPKEVLLEVIDSSPQLGYSLYSRIGQIFRELEDTVCMMGSLSVKERVAETVLILSRRFGKKKGDTLDIPLLLTRQDIASLSGTVIESAVRCLSSFKKSGMIDFDGKHITVIKLKELQKIAGTGPHYFYSAPRNE